MAKGSRGGKRVQAYINAGGRFPAHFARTHGISGAGVGGGYGATGGGGSSDTVQQVQPATTMSSDYNDFVKMSDDAKADVISKMCSQPVPDHLANNSFQRFIYNIGLNDKPDVVSEAELDKMQGKSFYRTVNNVYNKPKDISYNAEEIAKQVRGGSITRCSDTGGSALGRGLYFADSCSHSMHIYGNTNGNTKATCTMRGKFNSKAKFISDTNASMGAYREMQSGSKLGKALAKCDNASRSSIYALAKGYNVITGHSGYHNVLNRQALTMSDEVRARNSAGRW